MLLNNRGDEKENEPVKKNKHTQKSTNQERRSEKPHINKSHLFITYIFHNCNTKNIYSIVVFTYIRYAGAHILYGISMNKRSDRIKRNPCLLYYTNRQTKADTTVQAFGRPKYIQQDSV